jgi:putative membrane protein
MFYLTSIFRKDLLIIFILVMSVTHTFIDFIPSLVFGVPSPDTALSVLPGHKLVLEGRGYFALFLSATGSLAGLFFTILIVPFCFLFLERFYDFYKGGVVFLLVLTIVVLVLLDRDLNKIIWSIIIISFSSGFGFLVLNSKFIEYPMLVLFTGLFGISTLIFSLMQKTQRLPKQDFQISLDSKKKFFGAVILGGVASSFCSLTPGIGNSQAGILSTMFFKKLSSEFFIVVLGAINTINFALSIVTFYLISRSRNGSIFVISQISSAIEFEDLLFYLGIMVLVGIISFFVTLFLGKKIIKIIEKIDMQKVNIFVLVVVILIASFLTNWIGVLAMGVATALGLLCILLEVRRVHLMSVLIVPVIVNFL